MPRKPRIHLPGGVYHVTLRGDGRRALFPAAADGAQFLALLEEGTRRFGYRCHGYCLLPHRADLVIEAGAVPLPRAMQNLTFRHTRRVNRHTGRSGPLFRGRYQAVLVDAARYLPALVRQVHLSPVRAGLAGNAAAWRWSSHRAYLGGAAGWLTTGRVLGQLAARGGDSQAAWRDFVAERPGPADPPGLLPARRAGAAVLGDEAFVARTMEQAQAQVKARAGARRDTPPSLDAIVAAVASAYEVDAAALADPSRARRLSQARGLAGLIARETGAAPLSALAARFGRDLSSLSRAVRRVEESVAADGDLRDRRQAVQKAIMQV